MGLEIALYDSRPHSGRITGMLHLSVDHGDALAEALAEHALPSDRRLGRIDPYDDTYLNEQDSAAAFEEATALLARCTTEAQRAAVRDLRNMLANCAAIPGSWLCLMGD